MTRSVIHLTQEQLRQVQLTELEMLREVHRICEKYRIPYVIIAGTLLDVGAGKIEPDEIPRILSSKERKRAGQTAPPEGLCLWKVTY